MYEANRVRETATTTGTGSFTLAGPTLGYQTFAAAYTSVVNTEVYYGIVNPETGEWEVGIGTYLGPTNQLQRDLVLDGTDGGSKVNFSVGSKTVYVPRPAESVVTARCRRPTDVGVEIRAAAGQSANLLTAYNSAGVSALAVNADGGVAFGSRLAANTRDVSKHIDLYGGTYGFGIYSNRLNYAVPLDGKHAMSVDGQEILSVTISGVNVLGALTVAAGGTVPGGQNWTFGNDARITWPDAEGTQRVAMAVTAGVMSIGSAAYASQTLVGAWAVSGAITATGALQTESGLVAKSTAGNLLVRPGTGGNTFFQDAGGANNIARVDAQGTSAGSVLTVMTREKGDARYAAISSARFKPDAEIIEAVDVTQFGLKGWTWGGELDETHPRYGRPGSGWIAEEVAEVLPSAAIHDAAGAIVGLDALTLVAHLAAHVSTLEDRISALE